MEIVRTQTVLCVVSPMPFKHFGPFIFVEQPDGTLTLPGGEPGESEYPLGTAMQIAHDQMGFTALTQDIEQIGTLIRSGEVAAVVRVPFRLSAHFGGQGPQQTDTTGPLHQLYLQEALEHVQVPPELKLILPLAQSGLVGWRVIATEQPDAFAVTV